MKPIDYWRRYSEKSIHRLTLEDFEFHAIWDTVKFDVPGGVDLTVEPRPNRELRDDVFLTMPWIRVSGRFADSSPVSGIASVDLARLEFSTPSLFLGGEPPFWWPLLLPPAPQRALEIHGPTPLAMRLGRPVEALFPLRMSSEIPARATGSVLTAVFTTEGRVAQ